MRTMKIWKLLTLILVSALLLCACGGETAAPETTTAAETEAPAASLELGLTQWALEAKPFSSFNGASIDLTATPKAYAEGLEAEFVVRLEGEDVSSVPCQWDGSVFTAYADLQSEDGYCYYVILTGPDGAQLTVDVNTPTNTIDATLINLSDSLESYCSIVISGANYADGRLAITEGTAQVRPYALGGCTCTAVELVLSLDGAQKETAVLPLPEAGGDGVYTLDLSGISYELAEMEGEHQLSLSLKATLSDGQTLTDAGNTSWFYTDGQLNLSVG